MTCQPLGSHGTDKNASFGAFAHFRDCQQSLVQPLHQVLLQVLLHVRTLVNGPVDLDLDLSDLELLFQVGEELDGVGGGAGGGTGGFSICDGEGEVFESLRKGEMETEGKQEGSEISLNGKVMAILKGEGGDELG
jgi:hypothetical protein